MCFFKSLKPTPAFKAGSKDPFLWAELNTVCASFGWTLSDSRSVNPETFKIIITIMPFRGCGDIYNAPGRGAKR